MRRLWLELGYQSYEYFEWSCLRHPHGMDKISVAYGRPALEIRTWCIGVARGPLPPTFLAYIVILCFDRRYPKQNSVIGLKSNISHPSKLWAGCATTLPAAVVCLSQAALACLNSDSCLRKYISRKDAVSKMQNKATVDHIIQAFARNPRRPSTWQRKKIAPARETSTRCYNAKARIVRCHIDWASEPLNFEW